MTDGATCGHTGGRGEWLERRRPLGQRRLFEHSAQGERGGGANLCVWVGVGVEGDKEPMKTQTGGTTQYIRECLNTRFGTWFVCKSYRICTGVARTRGDTSNSTNESSDDECATLPTPPLLVAFEAAVADEAHTPPTSPCPLAEPTCACSKKKKKMR